MKAGARDVVPEGRPGVAHLGRRPAPTSSSSPCAAPPGPRRWARSSPSSPPRAASARRPWRSTSPWRSTTAAPAASASSTSTSPSATWRSPCSSSPNHSLEHAIGSEDSLDLALLDGLLTRHRDSLMVLAAPAHPDVRERVTPLLVARILRTLREGFDYVVVDTAPSFDEQVLTALDETDECVVVATLDVPTLRTSRSLWRPSRCSTSLRPPPPAAQPRRRRRRHQRREGGDHPRHAGRGADRASMDIAAATNAGTRSWSAPPTTSPAPRSSPSPPSSSATPRPGRPSRPPRRRVPPPSPPPRRPASGSGDDAMSTLADRLAAARRASGSPVGSSTTTSTTTTEAAPGRTAEESGAPQPARHRGPVGAVTPEASVQAAAAAAASSATVGSTLTTRRPAPAEQPSVGAAARRTLASQQGDRSRSSRATSTSSCSSSWGAPPLRLRH